jgi:sulfatase modifying factor 1
MSNLADRWIERVDGLRGSIAAPIGAVVGAAAGSAALATGGLAGLVFGALAAAAFGYLVSRGESRVEVDEEGERRWWARWRRGQSEGDGGTTGAGDSEERDEDVAPAVPLPPPVAASPEAEGPANDDADPRTGGVSDAPTTEVADATGPGAHEAEDSGEETSGAVHASEPTPPDPQPPAEPRVDVAEPSPARPPRPPEPALVADVPAGLRGHLINEMDAVIQLVGGAGRTLRLEPFQVVAVDREAMLTHLTQVVRRVEGGELRWYGREIRAGNTGASRAGADTARTGPSTLLAETRPASDLYLPPRTGGLFHFGRRSPLTLYRPEDVHAAYENYRSLFEPASALHMAGSPEDRQRNMWAEVHKAEEDRKRKRIRRVLDFVGPMVDLPGGRLKSESWPKGVDVEPLRVMAVHVTEALWQRVMGERRGYWWFDEAPVTNVSWYDAVGFCNRASELAGYAPAYDARHQPIAEADGFRLPTDSEWEYACRAGADTTFWWGNDVAGANQRAWFRENSDGTAHAAGRLAPNPLGLFDMVGNVWQWCESAWEGDDIVDKPVRLSKERDRRSRVLRGGSFNLETRNLRASDRGRVSPSVQVRYYGFRCVRGVRRQLRIVP